MADVRGFGGSFWSKPSNVEWCEAKVQPFQHSEHVAEFWNTTSNVCFIVVAIFGLRRALRLKLPVTFVYTDAMLFVVGCGSALFHSRRTYIGEVLDELPMSAMAVGYLRCLDGVHPATRGAAWWATNAAMLALALCSWMFYVVFHNYHVFTTLFTFQVLVPALISLRASPKALGGAFSAKRRLWWAFFFTIILGKGLWEVERWLHRGGLCPTSSSDPRFWLHPAWHLLSATAHCFWVRYAASLPRDGDVEGAAEASASGGKKRA